MSSSREAPGRKLLTGLGLTVLVLGVAALLRLLGLRWELPNTHRHFFSYHPDEVFLLLPTLRSFAHGDWNPHFFNYGSLYLYLIGLPALLLGLAQDPDGLGRFTLFARGVTAGMGIASVPLLYLAVRRESKRWAAIGAMLFAVLPLHAVNSHYATVDVPATFWLVLAFLFALWGAAKPGPGRGLLTGLAVGLAAATKYNAGLFLLPALLAPVTAPPRAWNWRWFAGVVGGAAAGFVIGCPYFTSPEFAQGLSFELQHMREGGTYAFAETGTGWAYHLVHGMPIALGFPLLLAVVLGIVATFRLPNRAARLSLLWVLLYLLMIGFAKERFIRYLVPIAPFLAVIAAFGLFWLWRVPRVRLLRTAGALAGAVVVLLTGLYCYGQVSVFAGQDPWDVAWSSIGVVVVQSGGKLKVGLVQPPWYFSPPVVPVNGGPMSRDRFDKFEGKRGSPVVVTGWDSAKLRAARPAFFYLIDLEVTDLLRLKKPEATEFVHTLSQLYSGTVLYKRPPAPFAWLAPGRNWAPPDWLYPSPEITLYHNSGFDHVSASY